MERRTFIKNSALASGTLLTVPSLSYGETGDEYNFPLLDLHVHTTKTFTIENILEIGEKTQTKFGIVDHPMRQPQQALLDGFQVRGGIRHDCGALD